MKSSFHHLQLNVDYSANGLFYREFMEFLGWNIIFEGEDMVGYKTKQAVDLWFIDAEKKSSQDYDSIGPNHVAIRVDSQKDVDIVQKFLEEKGIKMLFDTPKHREDFAHSESETYYQIMFESPDKILFEIVYIGAK